MDEHTLRLRRCDRCCAAAQYQVLVTSGLELLFCHHHVKKYGGVLSVSYPVMRLSELSENAATERVIR